MMQRYTECINFTYLDISKLRSHVPPWVYFMRTTNTHVNKVAVH